MLEEREHKACRAGSRIVQAGLLAGHGYAHFGLGVGDQVTGQVDGDSVQRAGEQERGPVVRGDRGAWVGAAREPAGRARLPTWVV